MNNEIAGGVRSLAPGSCPRTPSPFHVSDNPTHKPILIKSLQLSCNTPCITSFTYKGSISETRYVFGTLSLPHRDLSINKDRLNGINTIVNVVWCGGRSVVELRGRKLRWCALNSIWRQSIAHQRRRLYPRIHYRCVTQPLLYPLQLWDNLSQSPPKF